MIGVIGIGGIVGLFILHVNYLPRIPQPDVIDAPVEIPIAIVEDDPLPIIRTSLLRVEHYNEERLSLIVDFDVPNNLTISVDKGNILINELSVPISTSSIYIYHSHMYNIDGHIRLILEINKGTYK